MKKHLYFIALCLFQACQQDASEISAGEDWPAYLGAKNANHYSSLDQINTGNAHQLQVAWTYRSGDADSLNRSQIQCNPLIINGILYGSSPRLKFFALDATSGEEIWRFDPFNDKNADLFGMGLNRGLVHWTDGRESRLLVTAGDILHCLDAKTGQLIPSFGQEGRVDLHTGLGDGTEKLFITSNTPGVIYKDLLILGSRVNESTFAAPGHIRAFHVKTGELAWIFHTIPRPGEYGYDTWPPDAWKSAGGANSWAGMSLDEARGIVFAPTGSAAFDFYGGDRTGANLFANCVLALDANTGKRIWHFQAVHHDVWDRDLPCPPNLVSLDIEGRKVAALAQLTKSGHIFLLDRETGKPLFQVIEQPAPPSDLLGEQTWPTQPFPVKPKPFARQEITEADLTRRTPEAYEYARKIWEKSRRDGPLTPPSVEGTLLFPGFDGGGEWGGAAVDPEGVLYINASEMPWLLQMSPYVPKEKNNSAFEQGRSIYKTQCQSCHGADFKGGGIFSAPDITGLKNRMKAPAVKELIYKGKGAMPSYAHLSAADIDAVTAFVLDDKNAASLSDEEDADSWPYPYYFNGYERFKDPDGYPAITTPWGTLNAIDLNTGEFRWKVPFGEYPALAAQGMANTGAESYGGPVVTAGNVLFIAASLDEKFRVFDKRSGKVLFEYKLPAAGYATPATYSVNQRQYVVVACGGGKLGTRSGDAYVAFALPE
jgi:quinoprotein glucose dehydrogenase